MSVDFSTFIVAMVTGPRPKHLAHHLHTDGRSFMYKQMYKQCPHMEPLIDNRTVFTYMALYIFLCYLSRNQSLTAETLLKYHLNGLLLEVLVDKYFCCVQV